jgi:hypothetical protein
MFQLDLLIDTSVLPSNVMSLRDDKFIDFVKEEVGAAAAALLEVQGINCVKSLLMTSDVYSIMDVKSKSLDGFKKKYGYMQDDDTFVVHPGIKGNLDYLIDLLKQKCLHDAKFGKFSKRNQSLSSLDKTTCPSSTMTNSMSPVRSNTLSETIISKSPDLSVDEHKKYIIDALSNWCDNNKSKFNLSQFSLIEGLHYFISIQNESNKISKGYIKCSCEKWLSLTLSRGKFQMSNFYRHLQGLRNGSICIKMKEMIDNHQSTPSSLSLLTSNQQSCIPSDSIPQQASSPNLVPTIPLSVTIPSNSHLSTSRSISVSTDNDDDKSIRKKSSSSVTKRQIKRKVNKIDSSNDTRELAKRTRRQ